MLISPPFKNMKVAPQPSICSTCNYQSKTSFYFIIKRTKLLEEIPMTTSR